ncbi:putative membrane protein, partial [Bacteroides fragilis str. S36L5]
MATAFFSFWAALIKIYSYFRLYTFMSIYVKN